MARQISIFIVDDTQETLESIKQLVALNQGLTVVGEANSAEQAFELLPSLDVDVVLMDINMGGIDGIRAAEMLREQYPNLIVILMSVEQEPEYFRRAMLAGAHNYLVKPFSSYDLATTLRETMDRQRRLQGSAVTPMEGKVIALFSTKGGVGKTTISVNLATALKQCVSEPVALVDGVLAFGDVALFLNLQPKWTLYDAAREGRKEVAFWNERLLLTGPAGVWVLPAPVLPEQGEEVQLEVLLSALQFLKTKAAYVIIDLEPVFNEQVLRILDLADIVLGVATLDLPAVKNIRLALDTLARIGIAAEKTKIVLNRVDSEGAFDKATAMKTINHEVIAELPSDGKTVMNALNKGVPFVLDKPSTGVSRGVMMLARKINGDKETDTVKQEVSKGGWRRLLGGD